jgi:hypothetical protein
MTNDRPDTLRLRLGHYCLLPLVLALGLVRRFSRRQIFFTLGWVYTDSGKQRYVTFGPIRLSRK